MTHTHHLRTRSRSALNPTFAPFGNLSLLKECWSHTFGSSHADVAFKLWRVSAADTHRYHRAAVSVLRLSNFELLRYSRRFCGRAPPDNKVSLKADRNLPEEKETFFFSALTAHRQRV